MSVKIGAILAPQGTTWPELREAALRVEAAGLDSIWTWDHLLSPEGRDDAPILESWTLLSAIATVTERVTLSPLVSNNSARHPSLTAKLAITLDHISGGRAILGLGSGWMSEEHEMFGIAFEPTAGRRLDRLAEAVHIIRGLLDGGPVSSTGSSYDVRDARLRPLPVQRRLPLLIGGMGPRKTIPLVARHADIWHGYGSLEQLAEATARLEAECAACGRDPATIERGFTAQGIVRSDPAEARRVFDVSTRAFDETRDEHGHDEYHPICGDVDVIAGALLPYVEAGWTHVTWQLRPPFDRETIEGLGAVREALVAR